MQSGGAWDWERVDDPLVLMHTDAVGNKIGSSI